MVFPFKHPFSYGLPEGKPPENPPRCTPPSSTAHQVELPRTRTYASKKATKPSPAMEQLGRLGHLGDLGRGKTIGKWMFTLW